MGAGRNTTAKYRAGDLEALQEALEDSVKKYYAFYCLPCDEFSQTELEKYEVKTWPWDPKTKVRQGEEILSPEPLAGIGLESGVISYDNLYTLLIRLDFDVKGTTEHFTVTGADGYFYEFSYSFWEEKEMDWIYRGPVVALKGGRNIDNHNGYFHFYMPFPEITGLSASWD